jgi:hypothetical protein
MGSTVSTGKLAAAFKTTSGTTIYALYEQTYESNCYPHTPSWGCILLGDISAALRGIFRSASSCEGGMLKGAGGRDISPEGYVAGWIKELANPYQFGDRNIDVFIAAGYSAPLVHDQMESTKARMIAKGFELEATKLENGERLSLSLYEHGELLSSIYDGTIGAWRVIDGYSVPLNKLRVPELGYQPAKSKTVSLETPTVIRMFSHNDSYLIKDANGDYRNRGWAYSIIGSYVSQLWESELAEPGTFRNKIKAYREAIQSAPTMPTDAIIVIDINAADQLPVWEQENTNRVVQKNPHTIAGNEIHIVVPQERDAAYHVTCLNPECAKFVCIPAQASAPVQVPAPIQQLDLLAG